MKHEGVTDVVFLCNTFAAANAKKKTYSAQKLKDLRAQSVLICSQQSESFIWFTALLNDLLYLLFLIILNVFSYQFYCKICVKLANMQDLHFFLFICEHILLSILFLSYIMFKLIPDF